MGPRTYILHGVKIRQIRSQSRKVTCRQCGLLPYSFGPLLSTTHANREGVDNYIACCLCVAFCVCMVTDFSTDDKACGVTFCSAVHRRPRQGITNFCELCSSRSQKLDESASARATPTRTLNITAEMRQRKRHTIDAPFEYIARRVDAGSACVDISQSRLLTYL